LLQGSLALCLGQVALATPSCIGTHLLSDGSGLIPLASKVCCIGAILAWFNFRWLKQGLDALTREAAAQEGHPKPEVPISTYFKAAFRYGLIGLAVYVIFKYLNVPVLSMILGLCALGAATMAVSVYEILRPQE
jgi:uncharacterized membrane protein